MNYMTEALVYSAIGYVAGMLSGLFLSNVRGPLRPDPAETRGLRYSRVLGLCLLFLAALTVIQGLNTSSEQRKIADCQSEWTASVLTTIRERAAYTDQDRSNLNDLVRALTMSKDARETLNTYLDRQNSINVDRSKFQYPVRPTCLGR